MSDHALEDVLAAYSTLAAVGAPDFLRQLADIPHFVEVVYVNGSTFSLITGRKSVDFRELCLCREASDAVLLLLFPFNLPANPSSPPHSYDSNLVPPFS